VLDRAEVFPELAQLLSCDLNTPESFLVNRLALSFASLQNYLSMQTSTEHQRVILAEDFPSAMAALLLDSRFGSSIVYDAHEMYVEAINLMNPGVTDEFLQLLRISEARVWEKVDVLATVSPGIADIMSEAAGNREVLVIPNFASITRVVTPSRRGPEESTRFAFFGGAAPHRNVDVLAANWPSGPGEATLSLYMPRSSWADEVAKEADSNPNVSVCPPVAPGELVSEMSQYDFGVIPYAYPFPYNHASPNKFGEYLAAGLPILAHPQEFTASLIMNYQLGHVCDFTDATKLHTAIRNTCRIDREPLRSRVQVAFRGELNWEAVVISLVDAVRNLILGSRLGSPPACLIPETSVSKLSRAHVFFDYVLDTSRPLLTRLYRSGFSSALLRLVPSRLLRRVA
jgi:glycosyltransferase involved in cell wall biosynthesis